ncbi:hypothetical protein [Rhizobium leguminosarum]|uniref:hypothetical protein n=1 Tax=Rhizobium leguminosarum TaxID=384 RepID=UPI00140FCD24|nr:hypothetical protein [Rhizobium leguminosarum]QIO61580.1 hypothetical protein HA463_28075 [Rhizobium leguminosarum bv. trifolii]
MYIVDEVIATLAEAVPADGKLFFYMRQRRHFSDPHADADPYLRFPYLAFEVSNGTVRRFSHRTELENRELDVSEEYSEVDLGDTAVIRWAPHQDIQRSLVEQLRRTFLVFYHVSGSREHFIESVSRRFVREFVSSKKGRDLIDYDHHFGEIRKQLGIDILLAFQKNPFFKLEEVERVEDLIEISRGSSRFLKQLATNETFIKDLFWSIARKSVNYGFIEKPKTYYCINTLTEEHFFVDRDRQDTEFRIGRQAVLIFLKSGDRLSLDAVHNATKLISTSLKEQASVDREDPLFKVMRACQDAEEHLGTAPQEFRHTLESVIRKILEVFLLEVAQASQAERIAVWRYDTFLKELVPFASVGIPHDIFPIPISAASSVCVVSFQGDKTVWIDHRNRYAADNEERPDLVNDIGKFSDASHARPLWVGSTKSGVIEFTSSRSKRLVTEDQYFERIANTCGEVIRRLELANDRAWLSRMSYVHAARHRIESIIREIQVNDEDRAGQLRSLLLSYSIVQDRENQLRGSSVDLEDRVTAMLDALPNSTLSPSLETICREVCLQSHQYSASPRSYGLMLEILDTLGSNAGHSPLSAEDVSVETTFDEPSKLATMKIVYRPAGAHQRVSRLSQVCISPIKDIRSATYHFGLFLLAAQLRMVGGAAAAAPIGDDGLGNSLFGVSFSIPLDAEGAK